jgi:hypothetical protein
MRFTEDGGEDVRTAVVVVATVERGNFGTRLSHDLSSTQMESERYKIAVLISGSGGPRSSADSALL